MTPTQVDALVGPIVNAYGEAERRIWADIARRMAQGLEIPGWQQAKLAELGALLRVADASLRISPGLLQAAITNAYVAGAQDAFASLAGEELATRMANTTARAVPLVRELSSTLASSRHTILRSTEDIYRRTIARAAVSTLLGAEGRREAAGVALQEFSRQGITAFTDSRGGQWGLRPYIEMATRTAVHRSDQQGHADQLEAQGQELVIISKHAQECPLCRPWEGKVLSINASEDYPSLDSAKAAGLFHPNCRHRMKVYLPGITRDPPKEQYEGGQTYEHRQRERAIQSHVREWQRRGAAALTPDEKNKAKAKAKYWREQLAAHRANQTPPKPAPAARATPRQARAR